MLVLFLENHRCLTKLRLRCKTIANQHCPEFIDRASLCTGTEILLCYTSPWQVRECNWASPTTKAKGFYNFFSKRRAAAGVDSLHHLSPFSSWLLHVATRPQLCSLPAMLPLGITSKLQCRRCYGLWETSQPDSSKNPHSLFIPQQLQQRQNRLNTCRLRKITRPHFRRSL